MDVVRSAWARITAYVAHEDSRTASANLIALVVASNQPLYILYLYALIGGGEKLAPSFLTLLSTPFFLAVPFVSRLSSGGVGSPSSGDPHTQGGMPYA